MGLFGDLLKNKVEKLGRDVIGSKDVFSSLLKNETEKPESVSDRVRRVIKENYAEYELCERVQASELGGEYDAQKYSFMLCRDGRAKLTIMVLEGKNDYHRKNVRLAHKASESAGVPCINIMEYLPSTYEYIKDKIAENLI